MTHLASPPLVDVVIVHYRSRGQALSLARDALAQVEVDLRLVLVECGSDGTVEQMEANLPVERLVVLRPGQNLGYCAGNNLGFSVVRSGAKVLICNPDVRLAERDVVRRLLVALRGDKVAAVAPLLRTTDGVIEYRDSVIDLSRAVAAHVPVRSSDQTALVSVLPWVNGAVLLVEPEAWRAVGGFDERYFLFCEEVDWCLRASAAGWRTLLDGSVTVDHVRGGTFSGRGTKASYYYHRNLYHLCEKFAGRSAWRRHWVKIVIRVLFSPRAWLTGFAPATLWGAVDALRGRVGSRPFRP